VLDETLKVEIAQGKAGLAPSKETPPSTAPPANKAGSGPIKRQASVPWGPEKKEDPLFNEKGEEFVLQEAFEDDEDSDVETSSSSQELWSELEQLRLQEHQDAGYYGEDPNYEYDQNYAYYDYSQDPHYQYQYPPTHDPRFPHSVGYHQNQAIVNFPNSHPFSPGPPGQGNAASYFDNNTYASYGEASYQQPPEAQQQVPNQSRTQSSSRPRLPSQPFVPPPQSYGQPPPQSYGQPGYYPDNYNYYGQVAYQRPPPLPSQGGPQVNVRPPKADTGL